MALPFPNCHPGHGSPWVLQLPGWASGMCSLGTKERVHRVPLVQPGGCGLRAQVQSPLRWGGFPGLTHQLPPLALLGSGQESLLRTLLWEVGFRESKLGAGGSGPSGFLEPTAM